MRRVGHVWSGCIWRYHVLGTEGQGSQHYFVSMFSISVPFHIFSLLPFCFKQRCCWLPDVTV